MSGGRDDPVWRFATFNVRTARGLDLRHPWILRGRSVVRLLRRIDADVAGLQEARAHQLRRILRRQRHVASVGVGRDDGASGGEHCPVLFRTDRLRLHRHATRWYADDPDEPGARLPDAGHPRIATFAWLDTRDGRRLQVVNTHLDHQHQANRERSVELLLEWLDPGLPTVILGDLNARPDNPVVGRLEAAGFVACRVPDGEGTHHRFTGATEGPQIDHVLVSVHWEVVSSAVVRTAPGERLPSDHWPLVATLRLC
jgi:endonuclease/exonuclease/phosphatase family metal-dependent hydrolase